MGESGGKVYWGERFSQRTGTFGGGVRVLQRR